MGFLNMNNINWRKLCKGEIGAKQLEINLKNSEAGVIMGLKNILKKNDEEKLKVNIKVTYTSGSKKDVKTFKAYALFGKWFALNFKKVRIVDIKIDGDY